MRQLPNIVRLLICSLLIGGYGSMYAGSVLHELAHSIEAAKHDSTTPDAAAHAEKDCDHSDAVADTESEPHQEVTCFFCTHAPVISADLVVEQTWTPAVASLAPPVDLTLDVHSPSRSLPALRGPPTA